MTTTTTANVTGSSWRANMNLTSPKPIQFSPIPDSVTERLIAFARTDRIGRDITVDGTDYTLVALCVKRRYSDSLFYIEYHTSHSVVIVSNRWGHTNNHVRSRHFHHPVASAFHLNNSASSRPLETKRYAGSYPWRVYAGKAGKCQFPKGAL